MRDNPIQLTDVEVQTILHSGPHILKINQVVTPDKWFLAYGNLNVLINYLLKKEDQQKDFVLSGIRIRDIINPDSLNEIRNLSYSRDVASLFNNCSKRHVV